MSGRASYFWFQRRPGARGGPPSRLRWWLSTPDSLTVRIRAACGGSLHVRVLAEGWELPQLDEARLLGLATRRRVWMREVLLLCDGRPWVYARTVIPPSTLTGRQRRLRRLGSRPLGSVLFGRGGAQRRRLDFGYVCNPEVLERYTDIMSDAPLWARRSLLEVEHKPILVTEAFLPELDHGRAYGRGE